jgi:hypothetical protein
MPDKLTVIESGNMFERLRALTLERLEKEKAMEIVDDHYRHNLLTNKEMAFLLDTNHVAKPGKKRKKYWTFTMALESYFRNF